MLQPEKISTSLANTLESWQPGSEYRLIEPFPRKGNWRVSIGEARAPAVIRAARMVANCMLMLNEYLALVKWCMESIKCCILLLLGSSEGHYICNVSLAKEGFWSGYMAIISLCRFSLIHVLKSILTLTNNYRIRCDY